VISERYDQLARISIFVRAAVDGEMLADELHQQHFAELFRRLGDDLHSLMCALTLVHPSLGGSRRPDADVLSPDVVREIRRIRVCSVPNRALRHLRDYAVANSAALVAQRLASDVARMISQTIQQYQQ